MDSFIIDIPISVKRRTQRTLKLVGFGLKSVLTTKVPGRLVIRKKRDAREHHASGLLPWKVTPPLNTPIPPPSEKPSKNVEWLPATVHTEEVHQDLVSRGIKVRDFAYPAARVGHTAPCYHSPMAVLEKSEAKGIPSCVETAPLPSISMNWTEPHPALRPLPKREWEGTLQVPTTDKPYSQVYETHRIPGWFDQAAALGEHDFRLSQNPRTMPIRGLTTRRLLTLSPHLVDLERYDEIDLEDLRRYDRSIVFHLMHGIEPYPWRAVHHPTWTPSAEDRQKMTTMAKLMWTEADGQDQIGFLSEFMKRKYEDDTWEQEQLLQCARENMQNRLVAATTSHLSIFDRVDALGVTMRQRIAVWERRMDSDQSSPHYLDRAETAIDIEEFDAGRLGQDDGEDSEMARPPVCLPSASWPFTPGHVQRLPPFPLWGPKAPHDRENYYVSGGTPTDKVLNDYVAELSRCTATPSPWPAACARKHDYFAISGPRRFPDVFWYAREDRSYARRDPLHDEDVAAESVRELPQDYDSESESDAETEVLEDAPAPARKRGIDEVDEVGNEEGEGGGAPSRKRAKQDVPAPARKRGIDEVAEEEGAPSRKRTRM
ncbi:hypothetical protein C8R44DRAFT_731924 [Mycena epipterygia]|nr:hypothetical protein C8R44DRAFT_731924 [Mycena epipterygia]